MRLIKQSARATGVDAPRRLAVDAPQLAVAQHPRAVREPPLDDVVVREPVRPVRLAMEDEDRASQRPHDTAS
jgi:hypothetical protein